jgi:phage baseplate assembly protein gpV
MKEPGFKAGYDGLQEEFIVAGIPRAARGADRSARSNSTTHFPDGSIATSKR